MTTSSQQTAPDEQITVCLGAYGDICIVLPRIWELYKLTGQKQRLVVASNYADILEGTTYIEPVIYEAGWLRGLDNSENQKVVEWVNSKFGGKRICFANPCRAGSADGKSFVQALNNIVGGHDNLPLVFDNRNPEREAALWEKHGSELPVILVASKGKASPFWHRERLLKLVRTLPGCHVIDLAEVTAEKPYDLLGLFDRARMLVSIDTMHLHLSRGSSVPTLAIVRDEPEFWNGTHWSKRYHLHCRYSQYLEREDEIYATIHRVVNGIPKVAAIPVIGTREDGYNPSIIDHNGGMLMSYRFHVAGSWQTLLGIGRLDESVGRIREDAIVEVPQDLHNCSIEDMRFFEHRGELYGSYTAASIAGGVSGRPKFTCVIGYSPLKFYGSNWHIENHIQPKIGKNDWTGLEKNWVFFSNDGNLYCIYACHPGHVIYGIRGEKVTSTHFSPGPRWKWGEVRGGTSPLDFGEHWLRFFHSQQLIEGGKRGVRYYMGAYLMKKTAPFDVVAVSRYPILAGHEWSVPVYHCKTNVVIPYGAVKRGDHFLVSVGINDCASCLCRITENQLNL